MKRNFVYPSRLRRLICRLMTLAEYMLLNGRCCGYRLSDVRIEKVIYDDRKYNLRFQETVISREINAQEATLLRFNILHLFFSLSASLAPWKSENFCIESTCDEPRGEIGQEEEKLSRHSFGNEKKIHKRKIAPHISCYVCDLDSKNSIASCVARIVNIECNKVDVIWFRFFSFAGSFSRNSLSSLLLCRAIIKPLNKDSPLLLFWFWWLWTGCWW